MECHCYTYSPRQLLAEQEDLFTQRSIVKIASMLVAAACNMVSFRASVCFSQSFFIIASTQQGDCVCLRLMLFTICITWLLLQTKQSWLIKSDVKSLTTQISTDLQNWFMKHVLLHKLHWRGDRGAGSIQP